MRSITIAFFLFAGALFAGVLEIPYTGGKLVQSLVITFDNGKAISPDSIMVGNKFVLQPVASFTASATCKNQAALGLVIRMAPRTGSARSHFKNDTNWMAFPAYPQLNSMFNLDTLTYYAPPPANSSRGQGYFFASSTDLQCAGETYNFVDSVWRQVVFIQGPSVYAKLRILDFTQTLPAASSPPYQPKILNTITVRLIMNDSIVDYSADLTDPNPSVAIQGGSENRRRGFSSGEAGARVEYDLYNPLGIKLKRLPGHYQPTLSFPKEPGR